MKRKTFIYNTAHLPVIRHQIRWGIVFAVTSLAILIFQACLIVNSLENDIKLTNIQSIFAYSTLIVGSLLLMSQVLSIIKYVRIIKEINNNGSIEQTSFGIDWSKNAVAGLVKFISYLTLLFTSILAFAVLTNSILEYYYFKEINYYLPAVLIFLFANNYSTKSLENQILLEQD